MKKIIIRGFTLLEMLLVVIILAIMTAITVPQIVDSSREAQVAAAQASLQAINKKLDEQHQLLGKWPDGLEKSWFLGHKLPSSPWKSMHRGKAANKYGDPDWSHPREKTIETHEYPYWYNSFNGTIRIRVPDQGDATATIAFYNRVNNTNALSMSQVTQ